MTNEQVVTLEQELNCVILVSELHGSTNNIIYFSKKIE